MIELFRVAADVQGFCEEQGWRYIREQLAPLLELKEQPELLDQLEALRARLARLDGR